MACSIAGGSTIYVDDDATAGGNGESWVNAYKYLQDALFYASSGDEICVGEGVYIPDQNSANPNGTGNRQATFQLKNGVALRGGYAGLGETDPDARDIEVYETVLSGDLLGNDGPDFANNGENSYQVVTGSQTDATTVLDGFTITAGNANENYPSLYAYGGGIINYIGNPTVTDCTFSNNSAEWGGGGMCNYHSSPTLTNCSFSGNRAKIGGGMYNENNSNPTLTNCMFSDNSAHWAGGMYNFRSDPNLVNCTFNDNVAGDEGGGMKNGASSPTLTNCTFRNNSAE